MALLVYLLLTAPLVAENLGQESWCRTAEAEITDLLLGLNQKEEPEHQNQS